MPTQPPLGGASRSPITLLADRASRAIILTLGEARGRPLSAAAITDHGMAGATPRLIRDRIRELERSGILDPVEAAITTSSAPGRWVLTPAGQDLHRLQSLLTRIVSHAAGLNATTPSGVRDHVVELVLNGLADPVVVQITRCLAASGPLDPVALEEGCHPTPRRTLYRRLAPLVKGGVVRRTTSRRVPRSTLYELEERWRPAAAILILSAWWERRHHQGSRAVDLEGLLLAILPVVRVNRARDGLRVHWATEHPDDRLVLAIDGDRLTLIQGLEASSDSPEDAHAAASATGTPAAWISALVTEDRGGLTIVGDAALAREVFDAVRAALLTYVR